MRKVHYYNFILHYLKMGVTSYQPRNTETILNRAKDYYENNKDVLTEKSKNKYRELSEEKKNTKREYERNTYKNMSEEKKLSV